VKRIKLMRSRIFDYATGKGEWSINCIFLKVFDICRAKVVLWRNFGIVGGCIEQGILF